MDRKMTRREMLGVVAGSTAMVSGVTVGVVEAAEAKPLTVAGVAKSLLGVAEKAQREAAKDLGNASKWEEIGLIITRAAAGVMGVKVTGRGVRRDDEKGGEGDGTKM